MFVRKKHLETIRLVHGPNAVRGDIAVVLYHFGDALHD